MSRPALVLLLLLSSVARAGDPSQVWRQLDTPHFSVVYYEPNGDIARRVAVVAERAHGLLAPALRHVPDERTVITITDDTDGANGYASVTPRNQIGLFATAPDALSVLNDHDDWLYGLVAHEYAHILHLDTIGLIPTIYNRIFGKTWAPNIVQPRWFIEGLATYEESRRSSSGRTRSAIFDMYLRLPVLAGKPLGLDQVSSGPFFWPHGHAFYLYGGLFLKFIADRYGDEALAAISHDYGSQPIPYGLSRAVSRAVGKDYLALYADWMRHLGERYELQRDAVVRRGLIVGEKLTDTGEFNVNPRFTAGGRLVWQQDTGREVGGYRRDAGGRLRFDGGGRMSPIPGEDAMLVERAVSVRGNYAWNDLYRLDWNGESRRLTHGLRAAGPDVSPDGRRVAFTVNGGSRQRLAVASIEDLAGGGAPRIVWEGARWDQVHDPTWSPDGRQIVFAAWTDGGYVDLYLHDLPSGQTRQLTHDRAIDTSPRMTPDGRRVLFASDRTGIYNIYALDLDGGALRQVTNVLGGAFSPAVSPDGRTLVYSGFDGDGYELHRLPLDEARWLEPEVYVDDRPDPMRIADGELAPTPPRDYRPIESLAPLTYDIRTTVDSFGSAISVDTSGYDVIGRHGWSLGATYGFKRGDVSFGAAYSYTRLWPYLGASVGRSVGLAGGLYVDGRNTAYHAESWGASLSVGLPVVREPDVYADLSFNYNIYNLRNVDAAPPLDPNAAVTVPPDTGTFAGLTMSWSVSDVRGFLYSLGPVLGRGLGLALHIDHPALGGEREGLQLYYRWEQYAQLPFSTAAAVRLAGAIASDGGRYFLGGVPHQDIIRSVLRSQRQGSSGWLRGYPEASVAGSQYHLLNFEYRVPVVRIEKGVATLPFYFRRLHLAALLDVGNAFDGPFAPRDLRWSVGAALRLDMTFGFYAPGSFDVGYARGLSAGGVNEFWLLLTGGL